MTISTITVRESTKSQTVISFSQSPVKRRKLLTPTKSASTQDHQCSDVDIESTKLKVNARFAFTMQRFYLAYCWECSTNRGPTKFNGSYALCKKKCEAAHAALSPTLYDDKLVSIIDKVKKIGYNHLSTSDQNYLNHRFNLVEKNLEELSGDSRESHLDAIVSWLTPQEQKGSFINTVLGKARNATFVNQRSSNRVDCRLEDLLRPLEDQLAQGCQLHLKTPKQTLDDFRSGYEKLLREMENNLKQDDLKALSNAWDQLVDCQKTLGKAIVETDFKAFITSVEQYLQAYDQQFKKSYGMPKFKNLKKHLDRYQSPYVLKTLLKQVDIKRAIDWFQRNISHLKIPPVLADGKPSLFKEAQKEIEQRKIEAQTQLKIVDQPSDEIYKVLKMYFGTKDTEGVFLSPTKEQLVDYFNQCLQPVTPTRSDLKKKGIIKPRSLIKDSAFQTPSSLGKRTSDGEIKYTAVGMKP